MRTLATLSQDIKLRCFWDLIIWLWTQLKHSTLFSHAESEDEAPTPRAPVYQRRAPTAAPSAGRVITPERKKPNSESDIQTITPKAHRSPYQHVQRFGESTNSFVS